MKLRVRWLSGSRCDAAAFTLAGRTGTPTPMFPDSDSDYLNSLSELQLKLLASLSYLPVK